MIGVITVIVVLIHTGVFGVMLLLLLCFVVCSSAFCVVRRIHLPDARAHALCMHIGQYVI